MAPTLGFALLLLIFSINLFAPFFIFSSLNKYKISQLQKISFTLSYLSCASAVLSQLCLIYSFLISDYSVVNVYKNSHDLKPLIYKITGSWGNHEGSMLLLITILCAYTLAFNFLSKIDAIKKLIISSSQSIIIALFAAFAAFSSNPFQRIFPIPKVGLGLNPLLQDIGLALHPPMLYTGYLGFSLIFSFAIAGLLTEKIDKRFAEFLKPWLFFSWGFLTLGISLGAWWAYRELGWGGYWFWDPVENVSLMPWLIATALIHCLRILEKKEIFKIWTVFLAIFTFILCLLGIFLVRSGVLTSVHSFAIDTKRGFFVIALIMIIGGGALLILGHQMPKFRNNNEKIFLFSKIGAILFNNYFLLIALFIVLLGTIYPIFSRGFFDQFITIGPNYYNTLFSLLILPFLIFLALVNQLNYNEKTNKKTFLNQQTALVLLASCALTSLTFFYHQEVNFLQIIILILAIFSAIFTLISHKNLTMTLAHFGFSIIIIGIILSSSFGITKEINLKKGETIELAGYEVKFSDIQYSAGANFLVRQGNFSLHQGGKDRGILSPQLRYYPISEQTTNEAAIKYQIFSDFYLVIGNKDVDDNYALRAYYKPFIHLIWFGCILIFTSAIIKITRRTL